MKKWIVLIIVSLMIMWGINNGFAEQIKLKFLYETSIPDYIPDIIEDFMEENPNVKVELEPSTLEYFESGGLQLALSSGKGPDIIQIDAAPARMGLLANAGLLLPLDKFYEQYDWKSAFFPWAMEWVTYGNKKYGIPHEVEFIGPLYNKEIFKKLGLTEPRKYEDFITILEKLKNAGYNPPICIGLRNKYAGGWLFGNYIQACAGRKYFETILNGVGRWDNPWIIKAASEMQKLVKKKYISKDLALALKADEAESELWWTGKSGVYFVGTWLVSDIEEHSFPGEWFPLPPINSRLPGGYTGGLGSGFSIAKMTKYPEVATEVLNFIFFNRESQRKIIEEGKVVPAIPIEVERFDLSPLFKKVITTLRTEEVGYNPSVVIPGSVKEVYYENIVGLIGLMVTPEQACKNIQSTHSEWWKEQESQ